MLVSLLAGMARHRLLLVCLLALAASPDAARAQSAVGPGRNLLGLVVDIDSVAVANATVMVSSGLITTTDHDGSFRLIGVATTDVLVEVIAGGFATARIPVLADTETRELLVVLVRQPLAPLPPPEARGAAQPVREASGSPVPRPVVHTDRAQKEATTPAVPPARDAPFLQDDHGLPDSAYVLRGVSFFDSDAPVYIVDGVIVSRHPELSSMQAMMLDPAGRIAGVHANEIDTVEVLRAASAPVMYGSKAANGVVVITTKRGRAGAHRATVTQRIGFAEPSNRLGSRTFATIDDVRRTFCVPASSSRCDAMTQLYLASNGKTYDHEAELLRTTFAVETAGAASGGSSDTSYHASVLHRDYPGVVLGTSLQTQSGRLAIGRKLGARVRLDATAHVSHSASAPGVTDSYVTGWPFEAVPGDNLGRSLYGFLSGTPSFVDLQPQNGVYPVNPSLPDGANPLQNASLLQHRQDTWRWIVGSTLAIDAYTSIDGASTFKLLGSFGADRLAQKIIRELPGTLDFEADGDSAGSSLDASMTNLQWNAGAGALWTVRSRSGGLRSALSAGFTLDGTALDSIATLTVDGLTAAQQQRWHEGRSGVYAQEEVGLLGERLSLLAGVFAERPRVDGDSGGYYFYPKLAAAYWLRKAGDSAAARLQLLDTLRVRVAYGAAGNPPDARLTKSQQEIALLLAEPDGNLRPERLDEVELGLDLATRHQRVVARVTGYQRNISDLILGHMVANGTGFTVVHANGGSIRQRGIEAAIEIKPVATGRIAWKSRGTLALRRSLVTDLPVDPFWLSGGLVGHRIQEGRSPNEIVARMGLDTLEVVGNSEPDFRLRWSNVVSAGAVTLGAQLDWQRGSDIANVTRLLADLGGTSPDIEAAEQRLERFLQGDVRPYIEDASFVKLREIAISYAVPGSLGPVRQLEIRLHGRNLMTFTRYRGPDPELPRSGVPWSSRFYDDAPSPPSRSYWLSVTAGI